MKRPSLKSGMSVFVGCDVGEVRLSLHRKSKEIPKYLKLVFSGFLNRTEDTKYIHFSLTELGKAHVARMEDYYYSI